ncbi:hypothetical protein T439DRAFT_236241 [Meredithblackwellia eburnea MCA 4105]
MWMFPWHKELSKLFSPEEADEIAIRTYEKHGLSPIEVLAINEADLRRRDQIVRRGVIFFCICGIGVPLTMLKHPPFGIPESTRLASARDVLFEQLQASGRTPEFTAKRISDFAKEVDLPGTPGYIALVGGGAIALGSLFGALIETPLAELKKRSLLREQFPDAWSKNDELKGTFKKELKAFNKIAKGSSGSSWFASANEHASQTGPNHSLGAEGLPANSASRIALDPAVMARWEEVITFRRSPESPLDFFRNALNRSGPLYPPWTPEISAEAVEQGVSL